MQSLRLSQPLSALSRAGARSGSIRLRVSGNIIVKLLTASLALWLGGCATTRNPTTNTTGAVEELMRDENYPAVRTASPQIKAWAKRALNYVNDLSYELKTEKNK